MLFVFFSLVVGSHCFFLSSVAFWLFIICLHYVCCEFSPCFLSVVDCCVAFGTNASREGDVAWSMTTLYDPVGM